VESGQGSAVDLHQAAHPQRAQVDGGEAEVFDDGAEGLLGLLVVARVEQDPA